VPAGGKWTVALVAGFLLLNVLVPLRHFLYPGNVDWTEEGSRFAWRMMLCDKVAALRFVLTHSESGRSSGIDMKSYLTAQQLDKMSRDPEMMRQFASFLRDDLMRQGLGRFEVRVLALSALNGRKPQLLVDPTVDLAAQQRSLWPQSWIVPLVEPRRDEPWLVPQRDWERHVDVTHVPQRR
jgi:hypothetical protein